MNKRLRALAPGARSAHRVRSPAQWGGSATRCEPDLRSAEEKARALHCVGEDGSRPVLPDQRRPIGCTMTTGEDFGTALAGLTRASRARLAEHWAEYFGAPPPPRTSRSLMIRAVAYKLQERVLGGLSAATRRLLSGQGPAPVRRRRALSPRH